MVCEPNETDLDIHIPAVMLPQDAGTTLEKKLTNSSSGKVFSYSAWLWKGIDLLLKISPLLELIFIG